jgi:diguanylate cyclase (GGDEF)-like protein
VSRLLSAAAVADGPVTLERALVRESHAFADVSAALLVRVDEAGRTFEVAAGDPEPMPRATTPLAALPAVSDALTAELPVRLEGEQAHRAATTLGVPAHPEALLLVPARPPATDRAYVLILATDDAHGFDGDSVHAAAAFAGAAAASLGQVALLARGSHQLARQSALARAAKALNDSLDLARVLPRICQEAASILGADSVAVYRGSAAQGLVLEATHPAHEGADVRLEPGAGLAGRVLEQGRALRVDRCDSAAPTSPLAGVRSAMAAPMRWDGEGRGALWVGYRREAAANDDDVELLASFAELAAVACRNASVQAGLAQAARTDGLTGCLNHAALHETVRREMQRSRRTGRRLSIVLVDLDHFKQVNETQGHLVGDEVLRRVGRALREAVRPYDFVARYGGDEFAVVAVDADETLAEEIGARAIERVAGALDGVLGEGSGPHATAGVAEWRHGVAPSDLIREADRALLYGKQEGVRGQANRASRVPEGFLLGRTTEERRPPSAAPESAWPSAVRRETEPLRKRTRQLALANALGARLAEMTHVEDIVEAAVDELQRAFGHLLCAVVAESSGGGPELRAVRGEGFDSAEPDVAWRRLRATDVVERCLVERQAVMGGARSGPPGSELAVPIWIGTELWGVLDVQDEARGAFEEADVRLLETVADQLGAALRSATLFEQLERAYLGTAEALGAALEAKDAHTAEHARSIVANAERVGRRLGMTEDDLRDLRYAAAFHDIGKIAVPDSILNKPGPLTDGERRELERHPLVGEQILQPVEFLDRVRPLVRHCHERWDGSGYPDGLAGERIPLGARVIQVCDAHDAMTRNRPYRDALPPDVAHAEIRTFAGAQFDERVASAFLEAVAETAKAPA